MIQNLDEFIFSAIPLLALEILGKSEHSVGMFAAVVAIISLAFIAIKPFGILMIPQISAAHAEGKHKLWCVTKHYLFISFATGVVISLIFGYFAKEILILFQSHFIKALPFLYIALLNVLSYSISMPLARMIQFSEHGSRIGARLTLTLISVQTASSLVLIKFFGLNGAMMCYVGANLLHTSAMVYLARRINHPEA